MHDKPDIREGIAMTRKPVIAAVNGYCLGGGFELTLMCDIIIAGENAKFGFPEINIGIFPGGGGTQRLPRAIGKSKAMEMILTGNIIDAKEAKVRGFVNRVTKTPKTVNEAMNIALKIAKKAQLSILMAKEAVNESYQ